MQLLKKLISILIFFNFLSLFSEVDEKNEAKIVLEKKEEMKPKKENYFNRKKVKDKKIGAFLRKEFKELTFEELEFNKNIDLKNNNKEGATRYLERMISIWKPNPEKKEQDDKICDLRLELANIYFDQDLLDKAARNYKEFLKLYPGNLNAEFVCYRLICCLYKQSSIPERDQAETREAIRLSKDFLEKETFTKYKDKVKWILKQCNKKLLDSEIAVFNFYLLKGSRKSKFISDRFEPAQKRLDYIKENYLNNPETEPEKKLLHDLQEQLNAAKENKRYVPDYQKNKEPFYSWLLPATGKKRRYADRF